MAIRDFLFFMWTELSQDIFNYEIYLFNELLLKFYENSSILLGWNVKTSKSYDRRT